VHTLKDNYIMLTDDKLKERIDALNRIHKRHSTFDEYNQIWDAKLNECNDLEFREHMNYIINVLIGD
jgi:hypothetical protein